MSKKGVSLDALLRRATAGLEPNSETMFKPSLAYLVSEDPYGLWCRYHAPKDQAVDETTRYEKLRMSWGSDYELRWVHQHHPEAIEIKPRWGIEALEATLKAMLDGVPAIHAPQLWDLRREIFGVGDLIVRCEDAASDLGRYHYRVREIKRSKNLKDYQVLQAVLYNRLVDRIQGYRPTHVDVVLTKDTVVALASDYEDECDAAVEEWRLIRDGKVEPELPAFDEAGSPWRLYTNSALEKRRDLTLFPGVSASSRRKLQERLGVARVDDLENLRQEDFQRALGPTTGRHVYYKYRAFTSGMPFLAPDERISIPRRRRRFYFDFETCDDFHPSVSPHVYMIGSFDAQENRYSVFVARGAAEEEKIFRDFLAHVGDPRNACLYHWTGYEIGQMEHVIERHPRLKSRLSRLIESCVDLKAAIAKRVFFGTRTYSIKEVAPFLGFQWRQEDVDAYESMVLYWEWLEDGDPRKIERVVRYNEDDCMAMVHVDSAVEHIAQAK